MFLCKNFLLAPPLCSPCHTNHRQHQKKHFRTHQISRRHQHNRRDIFKDKFLRPKFHVRGIKPEGRSCPKQSACYRVLGKHQMLQKQPGKKHALHKHCQKFARQRRGKSKTPFYNQEKHPIMADTQKQPIPGNISRRSVKQADKGADRPEHLDIVPLRRSRINACQNILHQYIVI